MVAGPAGVVMGKRLIVLPWSCNLSADCCRSVPNLVMTQEERTVILDAISLEESRDVDVDRLAEERAGGIESGAVSAPRREPVQRPSGEAI